MWQKPSLSPALGFAWRIGKLHERLGSEMGKAHALNACEVDVLLFLADNCELNTAMDIARYRFISKSLVSKAVNDLVTRGLLTTSKDTADRRNVHLSICPDFAPEVRKMQRMRAQLFGQIADEVGTQELSQLFETMRKLSEAIERRL